MHNYMMLLFALFLLHTNEQGKKLCWWIPFSYSFVLNYAQ